MVDLGRVEEALLVTDYVYDDLEGHMATINAHVYAAEVLSFSPIR